MGGLISWPTLICVVVVVVIVIMVVVVVVMCVCWLYMWVGAEVGRNKGLFVNVY